MEERFRTVALGQEEADARRASLLDFIHDTDLDSTRRSIDMRIEQQRQSLDRLTELLIDGTISKADFEAKKQSLTLELAQERSRPTEDLPTEAYIQSFLELATSLHLQFKIAIGDEKRHMVQNLFSNRTLSPAEQYLEPQNWLRNLKNSLSAPDGDPDRHTYRTISLSEIHRATTRILDTLHETMASEPLSIKDPSIPKREYRLKNQEAK